MITMPLHCIATWSSNPCPPSAVGESHKHIRLALPERSQGRQIKQPKSATLISFNVVKCTSNQLYKHSLITDRQSKVIHVTSNSDLTRARLPHLGGSSAPARQTSESAVLFRLRPLEPCTITSLLLCVLILGTLQPGSEWDGGRGSFSRCWTISFLVFFLLMVLLVLYRSCYQFGVITDIHVHCKAGFCCTPIGRPPCHRLRNKQSTAQA